MPQNNVIKFYVNKEQFELIKKIAVEEGYNSISAFLRDLTLNKNILFREKIFQIHSMLKEKL